jgi:dTDP-4-dehydrorhamnose reductase
MKILITGSNGLLGQKLVSLLLSQKDHDFLATARGENRITSLGQFPFKSMDVTNKDDVMKVFVEWKPDVVIHTAAMTQVDDCEDRKEECIALNITAVENILEACNETNTHLVHVSTDFIFNGNDGPYDENATPDPISFYGWSKLEAEKRILDSNVTSSILRTILVYGIAEDMSRSNIVLWAKNALEKGQTIKVVDDQFRTPTLAEDLAQGCFLAATKKATGIFNIAGKDFMSVREIVARVAAYAGLKDDNVETISSSTLNQRAKRPPKTGLTINKAMELLGYQPHSFEEGIGIVLAQANK